MELTKDWCNLILTWRRPLQAGVNSLPRWEWNLETVPFETKLKDWLSPGKTIHTHNAIKEKETKLLLRQLIHTRRNNGINPEYHYCLDKPLLLWIWKKTALTEAHCSRLPKYTATVPLITHSQRRQHILFKLMLYCFANFDHFICEPKLSEIQTSRHKTQAIITCKPQNIPSSTIFSSLDNPWIPAF